MNIGGALGSAGKQSLGEFVWGETIVGICNSHLSDEAQLLLSDTGNDAYAKIVALPDAVQVKLLSMDVGVLVEAGASSKTGHVRLITMVLSVVMVLISTFATYHYNPAGVAEEEKSQMTQLLVNLLQSMVAIVTGI